MPINAIHLRAFHEVAAAGSYTVAAQQLHVSQPTLSEQVKVLERTYRVALFSRRGRGVALTPVGEQLLDVTRRLVLVEEEAERCLTSARDLTSGRLRLGTDAPIHAMPLLAAFARRHPGVALSLVSGNAEKVLADVVEYRVDAALVSNPPEDPRLFALPLVEDRFVAFVHRDDPLAARKRLRIDDLVRNRLIVREAGSQTRRTVDRALAAAGLTAGEIIEVDSREAAQVAVAMRLGIGVGAESELPRDSRLVAVPIVGAPMGLVESLVCVADRRSSSLISAVYEAAELSRSKAQRRGR